MKKNELMKAVAEQSGTTAKLAEDVIKSLIAIIIDEIKQGEKVALPGFGTFEVKETKERSGINPTTKETIKIPATKKPKFKPAKAFKEEIASK